MKKYFYIFIRFILSFLIVFSASYIICFCIDTYNSQNQKDIIDNVLITEDVPVENNSSNQTNPESNNSIVQTERMKKVLELQKENSDIIGWIEIENTDINYPVLQGTDNSFYMNHNYKKQKSINGSIFLDKDYNWQIPSSNLLIYGHNMKNNTMFQHLLKYKDKAYFLEHPFIRFTTANEDFIYEIISVFKSKVYYKSEKNVFRYYYFINAENEDDYNQFVQSSKNASLYDTGKTAIYGEQLMTLSTCSYHTKDGRFVVVAKKSQKYSD